uniref:Uncharacterized protein n=1 Tax=Coccolithus braarudii TaxID=221442 RepID=A0A7S0L1S3_9EUKA
MPILFMFLEVQVLDWHDTWFKLLWREALDLYLSCVIAWRVCPSAKVYAAHFAWVRPSPNAVLATSIYPRFFRWLLGSNVNAARADAAVQAATRRREARRE